MVVLPLFKEGTISQFYRESSFFMQSQSALHVHMCNSALQNSDQYFSAMYLQILRIPVRPSCDPRIREKAPLVRAICAKWRGKVVPAAGCYRAELNARYSRQPSRYPRTIIPEYRVRLCLWRLSSQNSAVKFRFPSSGSFNAQDFPRTLACLQRQNVPAFFRSTSLISC